MKKILFYCVLAIALVSCNSDSNDTSPNASDTGKGGSLARFTILNDYLYTVDNSGLNVFSIATPTNPVKVNAVPVGFNIETLFSYKNYLYIGSRNGMFVYDASNPEEPKQLSAVQHFTACDPVVANDKYAYVTLSTGRNCGGNVNLLEVYNVEDVKNPVLISSRTLTKPIGLALYKNYLFVCDDEVKIFDVTNPAEAKLVSSIAKNTFDVIINNDLLILIGETGLYQYRIDEANIKNITALSEITI